MTMMTLVEMVIAISMMTMMTTFQQLSFASKPVKVYTIFGIPQNNLLFTKSIQSKGITHSIIKALVFLSIYLFAS